MKVSQYSIKDLENLTNIKAHTIRIWEQRYGLLQPQRTATNIRFYLDKDLKKLLNINLLYTNGLKISKIAKLSDVEIVDRAKEIIIRNSPSESTEVDAIILAIMEMNSGKINAFLEESYSKVGLAEMYEELIIPLLSRVGELWQLNSISVGHEHFFSNLLRQFVLAKTFALKNSDAQKGKALLFLHSEEEHELSLLIYNYLFKKAGWDTCYLGQNVPMEGLEIVYSIYKPDICITSFIKHLNEDEFTSILNQILQTVPKEKLLTGGYLALNFKNQIPSKVPLIKGFGDLKQYFV